MLDASETTRTLLAWIEPPPFRALDVDQEDEPDFRLALIAEDGPQLFVEVEEGPRCRSGTMLWIEDRGSFVVAGVLARKEPRGWKTFMRLRAFIPPAAA